MSDIEFDLLDTVPEPPPETPKNQRVVIKDLAYHLQPLPPRVWRVNGLLAAGTVAIFSAWTGSGKTWLAYLMAVCIALGKDWLGFKTVQGNCLIVNEEMDEYDVSERLTKILKAYQGDETTPIKTISFARFNLFAEKNRASEAALLEKAIIDTGATFVIIDALADIMQGGDENAVKDTQPVFMKLKEIATRNQCVIVVIHHTGKNGATRGSSAIPGAVDLSIIAKRVGDSDRVDFDTEKERIVPRQKWAARMVWLDDQFYAERVETSREPETLTAKEQSILDFIADHPKGQATTKEITWATGLTRFDVLNLVSKRKINRIDGGGQGKEAVYALNL